VRVPARRILRDFFLFQLPFFAAAGAALAAIYFLELGPSIETAVLAASLALLASTPYLSILLLKRKYRPIVKKAGPSSQS